MASSKLKLSYLDESDWSVWDEFVRTSSLATVFQSTKYIHIYCKAFNRLAQVAVVKRGDFVVGGVVLYPNTFRGFSYLSMPYLIPYNGFVLDSFSETSFYYKRIHHQREVLEVLLKELEKKWVFCSFHQTPSLEDLRVLIDHKWEFIPEYTVTIPLQEVYRSPDLFIAKDQRRRIRNFEAESPVLEESANVAALYDMMVSSYNSHGFIPPISREPFIRFSKSLLSENLGRCFILKKSNQLLSGLLVIEDFPKVYAMFSGRKQGKFASSSEIYLLWAIIKKYAQENFQEFDLLGAMVPSIAKIKLELGGKLVRSDKIYYFRSSVHRILFHFLVSRRQKRRLL